MDYTDSGTDASHCGRDRPMGRCCVLSGPDTIGARRPPSPHPLPPMGCPQNTPSLLPEQRNHDAPSQLASDGRMGAPNGRRVYCAGMLAGAPVGAGVPLRALRLRNCNMAMCMSRDCDCGGSNCWDYCNGEKKPRQPELPQWRQGQLRPIGAVEWPPARLCT